MRNNMLLVRMTDDEEHMLEIITLGTGISRAEMIRRLIYKEFITKNPNITQE